MGHIMFNQIDIPRVAINQILSNPSTTHEQKMQGLIYVEALVVLHHVKGLTSIKPVRMMIAADLVG
jgi:hypothetical protein